MNTKSDVSTYPKRCEQTFLAVLFFVTLHVQGGDRLISADFVVPIFACNQNESWF